MKERRYDVNWVIAAIIVVILLSAAGSAVFAQVPESEVCSPPFLGHPEMTEPVPCRPLIPGILLQFSIDILIFSAGILLLMILWLAT